MSRYLVSPDAEADLLDIWHYLFEETGLVIADRIRNELLDAFTSLSDFQAPDAVMGGLNIPRFCSPQRHE